MPQTKSSPSTILVPPFILWNEKADLHALEQGWALWDADGVVTIQKIDDPDSMKNDKKLTFRPKSLRDDAAALRTVINGALSGDKVCALALFLEGRGVGDKVDVPAAFKEFRKDRTFFVIVPDPQGKEAGDALYHLCVPLEGVPVEKARENELFETIDTFGSLKEAEEVARKNGHKGKLTVFS